MESQRQYMILYNRLKREILADVYPLASTLPSENELCAANNLARSTVRQALSRLEADGYITKQKGKGSIIVSKKRSLNLLSFQGFSASVGDSVIDTLSVQEVKVTTWPADFSFELAEIEQGAGCLSFARVRLIDGHPVMFETTYLPNLNLPKFVRLYKLNTSFFEFLGTEYHIEITGMEQELWAIIATEPVAPNLHVAVGAPILKIHRKYFTNRPHLHIYSILYCTTEKYAMCNVTS